uniref:Uncharacterized protein n=1 Tax=Chromera velia CCMP2878 TaxID=1169474 RepID=A0A0G4G6I5_9ALVE|eukprot:Cvel_20494.t1-p1 / transcript=Cvel_20494.t1 / gene=Cvel_20494 / organism=Chromera_velia_CCMP2878 / gene_product=hypothetical protein / transcript_product=hypothetical protein / location=Cvel_scaffold1843:11873-20013(-) / protein_length=1159 / sequence_SO=supercontig / SO=protein_coding / is_pseudo=false
MSGQGARSRGETIQQLCQESRCNIQLPNKDRNRFGKGGGWQEDCITLTGGIQNVLVAARLIANVVLDAHAAQLKAGNVKGKVCGPDGTGFLWIPAALVPRFPEKFVDDARRSGKEAWLFDTLKVDGFICGGRPPVPVPGEKKKKKAEKEGKDEQGSGGDIASVLFHGTTDNKAPGLTETRLVICAVDVYPHWGNEAQTDYSLPSEVSSFVTFLNGRTAEFSRGVEARHGSMRSVFEKLTVFNGRKEIFVSSIFDEQLSEMVDSLRTLARGDRRDDMPRISLPDTAAMSAAAAADGDGRKKAAEETGRSKVLFSYSWVTRGVMKSPAEIPIYGGFSKYVKFPLTLSGADWLATEQNEQFLWSLSYRLLQLLGIKPTELVYALRRFRGWLMAADNRLSKKNVIEALGRLSASSFSQAISTILACAAVNRTKVKVEYSDHRRGQPMQRAANALRQTLLKGCRMDDEDCKRMERKLEEFCGLNEGSNRGHAEAPALEPLLYALEKAALKGTFEKEEEEKDGEGKESLTFVCHRGDLLKVLETPYERTTDWKLLVFRTQDGRVYLKRDEDSGDSKHKSPLTERGWFFETMMLDPHRPPVWPRLLVEKRGLPKDCPHTLMSLTDADSMEADLETCKGPIASSRFASFEDFLADKFPPPPAEGEDEPKEEEKEKEVGGVEEAEGKETEEKEMQKEGEAAETEKEEVNADMNGHGNEKDEGGEGKKEKESVEVDEKKAEEEKEAPGEEAVSVGIPEGKDEEKSAKDETKEQQQQSAETTPPSPTVDENPTTPVQNEKEEDAQNEKEGGEGQNEEEEGAKTGKEGADAPEGKEDQVMDGVIQAEVAKEAPDGEVKEETGPLEREESTLSADAPAFVPSGQVAAAAAEREKEAAAEEEEEEDEAEKKEREEKEKLENRAAALKSWESNVTLLEGWLTGGETLPPCLPWELRKKGNLSVGEFGEKGYDASCVEVKEGSSLALWCVPGETEGEGGGDGEEKENEGGRVKEGEELPEKMLELKSCFDNGNPNFDERTMRTAWLQHLLGGPHRVALGVKEGGRFRWEQIVKWRPQLVDVRREATKTRFTWSPEILSSWLVSLLEFLSKETPVETLCSLEYAAPSCSAALKVVEKKRGVPFLPKWIGVPLGQEGEQKQNEEVDAKEQEEKAAEA